MNSKRTQKYKSNFPFFYRSILSRVYSFFYREKINKIKTFVIFLGYPRSGHSIIGALLDAHPNITISHELNTLQLLINGVSKKLLFGKILSKAKYFFKKGSKWSGYSYRVKNQFQGNFDSLQVIGDKKGGATNRLLSDNIDNIKLLEKLNCDIKIIHVIRNPFDNIISRAQGGNSKNKEITKKKLERAINSHIKSIKVISNVKSISKYDILDMKMENFSDAPNDYLKSILNFIGVKYNQSYINDCIDIVKKSSDKRRNLITWQKNDIETINELINKTNFLEGYSFEQK